MSFLKKVFGVTIFRMLAALSGFLFTIIVARFVDQSIAGELFLGIAIAQVISIFIHIGMPQFLLREMAVGIKNYDLKYIENMLNSIFFVFSISSLIVVSISYFLYEFGLIKFSQSFFFYLLSLVLFFAIRDILSALYQSEERPVASIIIQNFSIPVLCSFVIVVLYCGDWLSSDSLFFLYSFSCLLVVAWGGRIWFRGKTFKLNLTDNLVFSKQFKKTLFSLFIVSIMSQLGRWAPQIIIGYELLPNDVAIFATAQRISVVVSLVLVSVNMIVSPQIAFAYSESNYDEINKLAKKSSLMMILISIPIAMVVFLFSDYIPLFIGEDYSKSALLLKILIFGQLINSFTGVVDYLLLMTRNEHLYKKITVFCGILSLSLSFVFIHFFNLVGASLSVVFSLLLQNLVGVYFIYKIFGFNQINIFRKI